MVVYIGDVDVRSTLHYRGVVVCCRHGGAAILAFRFTVLSDSFLLLLGLRWLLFFLALSIGFFFFRLGDSHPLSLPTPHSACERAAERFPSNCGRLHRPLD